MLRRVSKWMFEHFNWSIVIVFGVLCGASGLLLWIPAFRGRPIDASDVHYFRDDANQICFAYVRRHDFEAMVEVDCGKVRW